MEGNNSHNLAVGGPRSRFAILRAGTGSSSPSKTPIIPFPKPNPPSAMMLIPFQTGSCSHFYVAACVPTPGRDRWLGLTNSPAARDYPQCSALSQAEGANVTRLRHQSRPRRSRPQETVVTTTGVGSCQSSSPVATFKAYRFWPPT
jgi:hypothetical protein